MSNTTLTQVPSGVNSFYSRTMLLRAVSNFVHTSFGQVRDIPRNSSEVIKFRRYGNLTAATTALTEGTTPTGSQLSTTDISATVAQYGDFVTLTDLLSFTTLDPLLTETAEVLGDQAGDTLDQVARDVLVAGTTVQYASTAASRGQISATMVLNQTEVKEAVRTLQAAKARKITRMITPSTGIATTPINAAFIGIVSPQTLYDLKGATGWTPVEKYPSQVGVMPGEVGALDDVRFIMSPNAKVFATSGTASNDVHATLILAQQAYGITRVSGEALKNIIKPLGSSGSADPLDQRSTSGWKATFVCKRLNENFMVRIEHGVTA